MACGQALRSVVAAALLTGTLSGICAAAPATPVGPLTSASPAGGAVTVDGRLDEPAWSLAVTASEFTILGTRTPAPRLTTFRFLYTDQALLVGVECQTKSGGRRVMPVPVVKEHDGPVFTDESVELYLQPKASGPYYHFAANSLGVQYEGQGMDSAWNGEWTARTSESDLGWQLEISIPYRTLGLTAAPQPGESWRCNLCRNDRTYQRYCTWADVQGGFHDPEHFAPLYFLSVPVGLGPRRITRAGRDLSLAVEARSGPAATPLQAQFMVQTPAGRFDRSIALSLAPGAIGSLVALCEGAWRPSASVSVGETLTLGGAPLYRAPLLAIPSSEVRPERPAEPVPVTIGNRTVTLSFDQSTGNLLAAENKPAGLKITFGSAGTPILELDTVRFLQNPRFFRPEDVQTLVPGGDTLAQVRRQRDAGGETLVIEHRVDPGIALRLTITVPVKGTETQWRLELENELAYEPSKALVVHRVRYPYFSDVSPEACGANPFVILPTLMGQQFPDPGKNLVGHGPVPYIGSATMGWLDFYGANGGLYVKVGDGEPLPQTALLAQSDAQTHQLTLGLERWSLAWPGQKWSCASGVALHGGDWHAAADLYRDWFRRTFKLYQPPSWLQEADGYVMSGSPTYEFADFPRALDNAKAMGLNYLQLWSEMTGGDITYHAFAFPNPYMGTPEELTRALADLHARGGHIGFYLNFITGDPLMGTFSRQPMHDQKIPKDIPRPARDYMQDNWVQQALMSPAGSYSTWNTYVPGYLDGYWNQCPAATKWTDYYYYWVIDKWAKQYRADVWYLDSCPVSLGYPCFASDHGHVRPAPEGQSIINFYKRLRAGAPPGFCLMQEYSSDRLLPYSTHALGLPWHVPFARPEVVRYTLPEYPLFSGLCDGFEGVKQFYDNEPVTYRDALEFVFLIGNRYEFGMSNRPPDMIDPWQKKMVDLRRACRPEMNHGDFLDSLGLGTLPPRVYARLFRRADRGRLAVTLLDRRSGDRQPFTLSLELTVAGAGAPRSVKLVTLDGEQALPVPQPKDGRVEISVPVFPPRTAALLIETVAR